MPFSKVFGKVHGFYRDLIYTTTRVNRIKKIFYHENTIKEQKLIVNDLIE